MRELLNADFADVNDQRNIVFHFRRVITPKDTDRLRYFRDRLNNNRKVNFKQNVVETILTGAFTDVKGEISVGW